MVVPTYCYLVGAMLFRHLKIPYKHISRPVNAFILKRNTISEGGVALIVEQLLSVSASCFVYIGIACYVGYYYVSFSTQLTVSSSILPELVL